MKHLTTRRSFLRNASLGAMAASTLPGTTSLLNPAQGQAPNSDPKSMNVLFLFADQLQAFALSCMGNPDIRTPNLDRMASQGTLFTDCYSNAPVCGPFRGVLLTGRYRMQNKVMTNGRFWTPEDIPVTKPLKQAGYVTSYIGKWHLGGAGNIAVAKKHQAEFDRFLAYQCHNNFRRGVWFFDKDGKKTDFDGKEPLLGPDKWDGDVHRTTITTDLAIKELESLTAMQKRFALFVSYQNPHYPEQPLDAYYKRFRDHKFTYRPNHKPVKNAYTQMIAGRLPHEEDESWLRYRNDIDEFWRCYAGMVEQLDGDVGRIMATMDRLGISKNTVLFFTSDHGEMGGSKGRMNKSRPEEESCRIPLIVRNPRGKQKVRTAQPVSSVDFACSILDAANIQPPKQYEGISLLPMTQQTGLKTNRPVFADLGTPGKSLWCMVRHGQYKLIANDKGKGLISAQLYNLKSDPYEMNNLNGKPTHATPQKQLEALLHNWHKRVSSNT